jgi:hypothetical protein
MLTFLFNALHHTLQWRPMVICLGERMRPIFGQTSKVSFSQSFGLKLWKSSASWNQILTVDSFSDGSIDNGVEGQRLISHVRPRL